MAGNKKNVAAALVMAKNTVATVRMTMMRPGNIATLGKIVTITPTTVVLDEIGMIQTMIESLSRASTGRAMIGGKALP
jgi:hypothetical protein